jgi:hypothetical protein
MRFVPEFPLVVRSAALGGARLVAWRFQADTPQLRVAQAFFPSAQAAAAFARIWARSPRVTIAVRVAEAGYVVVIPVQSWPGYGHGSVWFGAGAPDIESQLAATRVVPAGFLSS